MSTCQRVTIKALVEELREMLPEKVDYADLVCAEGSAHGSYYVYEDPGDYIVEEAADRLETAGKTIARLNSRLSAASALLDDIETASDEATNARLKPVLHQLREFVDGCASEIIDVGYTEEDIAELPY